MIRRRSLLVAAVVALLLVTIGGAKPVVAGHVGVDNHATLSTDHGSTGLTALRHKAGAAPRSLLRNVASLAETIQHDALLLACLVVLASAVVARRQPRSLIVLRGPPSLQLETRTPELNWKENTCVPHPSRRAFA